MNHENITPPNWLLTFFRWFCHQDFVEDIEGDLLEMYEYRIAELGRKKANQKLFLEIISLIKLNLIKPREGYQRLNNYGMLKNYFKVAWRSLLKQKLYSTINIGGLALGITCFLTIFTYVRHELSYDLFHKDADKIYRVYQQQPDNIFMGSNYFSVVPAPLAGTMKEEIPEVKDATIVYQRKKLIGTEDYHFLEQGLFVDENFFNVFDLDILVGNKAKALSEPNSILLSETFAKKIFEEEDALGKVVLLDNDQELTVTGVIKDIPINSTLAFNYLVSFTTDKYYKINIEKQAWRNSSYQLFFKANQNNQVATIQTKLQDIVNRNINSNPDLDFEVNNQYFVQPLSELHLDTLTNFDIGMKGNKTYVHLFSWVAVIILLLACINYMNLAIVRSVKRTKEVGMRKVIGAKRGQVVFQFISESILITTISVFIALGFTQILLPIFAELVERPLALDLWEEPMLIVFLGLIVFVVGLISGSYPALFISSVRPIKALKEKEKKNAKLSLQRVLTVMQFAASIFLAISSLVIFKQFQFIQEKELGYDTEHIVNIQVRDRKAMQPIQTIRESWMQHPTILNVSASVALPSEIGNSTDFKSDSLSEKEIQVYQTHTDASFFETYGIELVAGRYFSNGEKDGDNEVCVLNESAVKALGKTPEEVLGTEIYMYNYITVVGVIKDFHMHSMHIDIQPLVIRPLAEYYGYISVKIQPENIQETIAFLEDAIREQSPYPFEYKFFEDEFDRLYKSEIQFGKMFNLFTILSLLIASLGLFGLAAFSATQRTKEIGVRKVLGASIQSITMLITKDFIVLVIVGFVLAAPVAWYAMSEWLGNFAYRIDVEWWMILLVGIASVVVSIATVSSQSLKAAFANPVESLRSE